MTGATTSPVSTHEELEAIARTVREHEAEFKARFEQHQKDFGEGPPFFSAGTATFWAHIHQGKFMLNRCSACKHVHFPPRVICPNCWESDSAEAIDTPGTGTLVSYTELHVVAPALKPLAPVCMAVIDLDEGVRLLTWLRGVQGTDLKVGARCHIVVEEIIGRNWFVARLLQQDRATS